MLFNLVQLHVVLEELAQLFQNYMELDEEVLLFVSQEQLRRVALNPLRSPFARLLRRESDERKAAQCSRVLCSFHAAIKRKYDLAAHRKKLENIGRRSTPAELAGL